MPQRPSCSSSVPATRDARHPHPRSVSTQVTCVPAHGDTNPGNGAFRLTPGFPTIGAGTNARVRAPSNSGESHGQKDLPADRMAAIMPADGGGAHARAEANRVADQQSTPSTYMTLAS
jgi:hypothetical protein